MKLGNESKTSPLISIVTVVLNDVQSIEKTIQSVLINKNQLIEYIVVDGGSIDGTLDVVNYYKGQIDIIVSGPDGGLYDAMNIGIAKSSGLIVGLLNSGDYYEIGALSEIAKLVNEYGSSVIYYSDAFLAYSDMNLRLLVRANITNINKYMSVCHQATFIPRSIYQKYGCYSMDYRFSSDFAFLLKLYLSNESFIYCEVPLVTFSTGGLSDSRILQSRLESIKILFRLNSPYKLLGTTRYMYEVLQMYVYKIIILIAGEKLSSKLRTFLFHKKSPASTNQ